VRRSVRILAAVGGFLLVLIAVWLLGGTSSSVDALRKFKAELQAKGEKLTFDELMKSRSTAVNNSHETITNVAHRLGSPALSPSSTTLRKYVASGQAQVAWKAGTSILGTNAPSPQAWEQFAQQLSTAEPELEKIRLALRNPAPDAGPMTNAWARRIDFVAVREAAYWLSGAALSQLRQGNLEAALQNLEALAGLARMDREEYTLVAQMIRVTVAGVGLMTTWEALQSPRWTEPQLARLQRAWEEVDLADAVERALLGERANGMVVWRVVRQPDGRGARRSLGLGSGGPAGVLSDYVLHPLYKLTSINDDELLHLQILQETLEAVRLVQQHRTWPEIQQRLTIPQARLNQLRTWSASFRYPITSIAVPNTSKAIVTALQTETDRQLTITAIGLRRFEFRHGAWPQKLDELIPEFLAAVPADLMSGKSLRYRPDTTAGFILYSVGVDGRDDGGDPTPAAGSTPGLWEGRDAVWPSAAP
jgi:hypothetical protein